MSRWTLRDRDRRALLIGLIAIGPLLSYRILLAPYLEGVGEVATRIELEENLLTRELDVVREQPEYPERSREASAALRAWTPKLFGGIDELAASSAVTNYLVSVARESRVLIQSSEALEAEESSASVVALRVSLSGESDLEGVVEFLRRLEGGDRLLHVEELTVRQARGSDGDRSQDELLSFSAVVRAFALGGSDDPDAAPFATIGSAQP